MYFGDTYSERWRVVVDHEWIVGPELCPSDTQLLSGIRPKPAHNRTHKWDAKHLEAQKHCRRNILLFI